MLHAEFSPLSLPEEHHDQQHRARSDQHAHKCKAPQQQRRARRLAPITFRSAAWVTVDEVAALAPPSWHRGRKPLRYRATYVVDGAADAELSRNSNR